MMGDEFEDIFSSINIEHEEYHENIRSLAEIAVARLARARASFYSYLFYNVNHEFKIKS